MKVGDRVKRSDADFSEVRAYRDMRGTVVKVDVTYTPVRYQVQWDCDRPGDVTMHWAEDLVSAGK